MNGGLRRLDIPIYRHMQLLKGFGINFPVFIIVLAVCKLHVYSNDEVSSIM